MLDETIEVQEEANLRQFNLGPTKIRLGHDVFLGCKQDTKLNEQKIIITGTIFVLSFILKKCFKFTRVCIITSDYYISLEMIIVSLKYEKEVGV